jgi:hypothetical protein
MHPTARSSTGSTSSVGWNLKKKPGDAGLFLCFNALNYLEKYSHLERFAVGGTAIYRSRATKETLPFNLPQGVTSHA